MKNKNNGILFLLQIQLFLEAILGTFYHYNILLVNSIIFQIIKQIRPYKFSVSMLSLDRTRSWRPEKTKWFNNFITKRMRTQISRLSASVFTGHQMLAFWRLLYPYNNGFQKWWMRGSTGINKVNNRILFIVVLSHPSFKIYLCLYMSYASKNLKFWKLNIMEGRTSNNNTIGSTEIIHICWTLANMKPSNLVRLPMFFRRRYWVIGALNNLL